jgi:predicted DNA-binding protein
MSRRIAVMSSAMALRLDEKTREKLARLAARRGTTRSALVREAIDDLIGRAEGEASARPWDLLQDILGSVRGGDPDRATDGGRKVARMLRQKRATR